jgi:hypothetical protein
LANLYRIRASEAENWGVPTLHFIPESATTSRSMIARLPMQVFVSVTAKKKYRKKEKTS